ncbi:MAG: UPF0261 family protein [Planctomycetota bacterium]|nr:MAG: UPF0261 family protein [Planctomycetota bacterium]
MATIVVLGTFDTKGAEHRFLADAIRTQGHQPLLVDCGGFGHSQITADISAGQIAAESGIDLAALRAESDRGAMVTAFAAAAPHIVRRLHSEGRLGGIVSMGGSGGTIIGTAAMRSLPLGVPKVMVSTLASGNVAPYLDVADIVMIPAVSDVAGLNVFTRAQFTRAAAAICALVDCNARLAVGAVGQSERPLIVASMFGNTTPCVERARDLLEESGRDVVIFHATGTGGRTMESLIAGGPVAGVLDVTTTEWADELVGGILGAGPKRLDAAATRGIPAVIAPGCLDMVNFGAPETVPEKFRDRRFYQHNAQVTLMRTTPEECQDLGKILAEKVNRSTGPATVLLPLKGISMISVAGQPFYDAAADDALFSSIRTFVKVGIPLVELDCAINDPRFAEACVGRLLAN